jgi:hypothetical protein
MVYIAQDCALSAASRLRDSQGPASKGAAPDAQKRKSGSQAAAPQFFLKKY